MGTFVVVSRTVTSPGKPPVTDGEMDTKGDISGSVTRVNRLTELEGGMTSRGGYELKCRFCGKRGCESEAHFRQSPECWEAKQGKFKEMLSSKYPPPIFTGSCRGCDRTVYGYRMPAWCIHCLKAHIAERQKSKRAETRIKSLDCPVCGESFKPKRRDAVTCSSKCRQKLHRQRKEKTHE